MSWLQHHPFAVDALLRRSLVLGYAAPIEVARALLPPQLEPDSFDGTHGFLAVAIVDTQNLRPAGFPGLLARDFLLIGYRVFARFRTASGKRLRGLYILRSETDRRSMTLLGNIFTQYRYLRLPIAMRDDGNVLHVNNGGGGLSIAADRCDGASLPANSPFRTWQEARRFAGPLPFTFSTFPNSSDVLIVEGSREHWIPQPVTVMAATVPYLDSLVPAGLQLANAFVVEDIPYHWKKGRREKWEQTAADFRD